jgi:hypothetical protein
MCCKAVKWIIVARPRKGQINKALNKHSTNYCSVNRGTRDNINSNKIQTLVKSENWFRQMGTSWYQNQIPSVYTYIKNHGYMKRSRGQIWETVWRANMYNSCGLKVCSWRKFGVKGTTEADWSVRQYYVCSKNFQSEAVYEATTKDKRARTEIARDV